jgi:DsbC/DsbD-like thiol-disulfide interchange protein
VVAKYFEEDYTQRYTASDILVREFGASAGAAESQVETRHLTLSASASTASARPGQRIALVLQVDLKPKMHVYAPGVEGYIGIEWNMKPTDAVIVHDVTFPPSEQVNLPAIGETVPAYKNHIRLVRDITIGSQEAVQPLLDADGNLTVEGSFRYQACDDRTCYIPVTARLHWKIHIEPQDRERAPEQLRRRAVQ